MVNVHNETEPIEQPGPSITNLKVSTIRGLVQLRRNDQGLPTVSPDEIWKKLMTEAQAIHTAYLEAYIPYSWTSIPSDLVKQAAEDFAAGSRYSSYIYKTKHIWLAKFLLYKAHIKKKRYT